MIRFKLAVALLLGSTVACAQNEKKLQADFLKPTLEYRMNVNRHSMPRDDREQDSMIQWIISNGYGGMATNVNPNEYLKSDEELKVFNRFVHASKARGLDLWLYDEKKLSVRNGRHLRARRTSGVGGGRPSFSKIRPSTAEPPSTCRCCRDSRSWSKRCLRSTGSWNTTGRGACCRRFATVGSGGRLPTARGRSPRFRHAPLYTGIPGRHRPGRNRRRATRVC